MHRWLVMWKTRSAHIQIFHTAVKETWLHIDQHKQAFRKLHVVPLGAETRSAVMLLQVRTEDQCSWSTVLLWSIVKVVNAVLWKRLSTFVVIALYVGKHRLWDIIFYNVILCIFIAQMSWIQTLFWLCISIYCISLGSKERCEAKILCDMKQISFLKAVTR